MKRGLKAGADLGPETRIPFVETCAPMKRGLKDTVSLTSAATQAVETYAPMKRGLKVSTAPSVG